MAIQQPACSLQDISTDAHTCHHVTDIFPTFKCFRLFHCGLHLTLGLLICKFKAWSCFASSIIDILHPCRL